MYLIEHISISLLLDSSQYQVLVAVFICFISCFISYIHFKAVVVILLIFIDYFNQALIEHDVIMYHCAKICCRMTL